MKLNKIIAIGGLKNSGKDEAAKMLQFCLNTPKIFHNYLFYRWLGNIFNKINFNYTITSFAHPLKKTLAALLNIDIKKFEDRNFKENFYIYFPTLDITNNPNKDLVITDSKFSKSISNKDFSFIQENYMTIRQLLQVFGTECMRGLFGNKLWILLTLKNKNKIIISDLRFKVEAEAIKENNGTLIYINRDICIPGNHASEKEIIDLFENKSFNYTINNNKSLKDLFYNISNISNQL